jgi:hypothetical protein
MLSYPHSNYEASLVSSVTLRYNAERLSNGLGLVKPILMEDDAVIEEGYYHNINDFNLSTTFANREPNTLLKVR